MAKELANREVAYVAPNLPLPVPIVQPARVEKDPPAFGEVAEMPNQLIADKNMPNEDNQDDISEENTERNSKHILSLNVYFTFLKPF